MNIVGALVWKNRYKKQDSVASLPRTWESRTRRVCGDKENTAGTAMLRYLDPRVRGDDENTAGTAMLRWLDPWVCGDEENTAGTAMLRWLDPWVRGDEENTAGTAMLRCLDPRVGILFALPFLLLCAGCTPSLHDVIGRGELQRAETMLAADPTLAHSTNELGKQPLHYAVFYKQDRALDMLLEAGADVNAADNTGMTALHTAAWMGRKETLWLLAHGADLTQRDVFGDRPSHTAAIHDQVGVLRALFKAGDTLTERNNAGLTPLELARKYRNPRAAARIEKLLNGP